MKKTLALFLAATVLLGLAACGKADKPAESKALPQRTTETTTAEQTVEEEEPTTSTEPVMVGSFVGKPYSEIEASPYWQSTFHFLVKYERSNEPAGQILAQDVDEGVTVNKGSTVMLTVSSGPNGTETPDSSDRFEQIMLPNVIGMAQAMAEQTLSSAGFTVSVRTAAADDSSRPGEVKTVEAADGSTLKPGSFCDKGAAVTIVVWGESATEKPTAVAKPAATTAKPAATTKAVKTTRPTTRPTTRRTTTAAPVRTTVSMVRVGKFVGKLYNEIANSPYWQTNFRFQVNRVPSDQPQGIILAQSVAEGREVAQGTIVVLTVSDGPENAEEPT